MGLLQEFKKFALKGNVIDMAVGIVIGASFTKIVNSLVADVITPLIGALSSGKNFVDEFIWFGSGNKPESLAEAKTTGDAFLAWGSFVQATIDFLIVAAAMFIVIKLMNRAQDLFDREEAEKPPPAPPEDIQLLREIRDSLASK